MKHRIAKRTLGRDRQHRRQMFRTMARSLIEHGSLVTSEAKAKEFRRFIEPVFTSAADDSLSLHARREVIRQLGFQPDQEFLAELSKAYASRPGGYLRLVKMPILRTDGARMIRIEML